ncbi:MAG: hypothetical protein AB8B57_17330 [Congregibacter sp.]
MQDMLLHGHIFKNAGTTLDWSLQRSFGAAFFEHRDDAQMRQAPEAVLSTLLSEDGALRALSSHSMPCPAPDIDGYRFSTLLMLRHPLKRVRSVYDFERRQNAKTPGAIAAKEKTYEEYVAWRMRSDVGPTIRNFQTRYLSGAKGNPRDLVIGPERLSLALSATRRFPGVGIVERYDESMVLFEYALRETFPELDLAYLPQNVSSSKLRRGEQGWFEKLGESHNAVIDGNAVDLVLYETATRDLDARIAEVADFDTRYADFKARCQALA